MKTYNYYPKDSEAMRLHEGSQTIIILPAKVQPPEGNYKFATNCSGPRDKNHGKHHWLGIDPECEYKTTDTSQPYFTCPLGKPGSIIHVKEAFVDSADYCWEDEEVDGHPRFLYRADCPESSVNNIKWCSPVTMPKEAVRTKPVVKEVKLMQLKDMKHADVHFEYDPFKDLEMYVWVVTI